MIKQQQQMCESPRLFVERLLGNIHTLSLQQLSREIERAEAIQQAWENQPHSFMLVEGILKRRFAHQEEIRMFQTALKVTQLQLKLLGRKMAMAKVEVDALRKHNENTVDSDMLVQMVDRILTQQEYQKQIGSDSCLEHPKQKSYDQLIRSIENLPTNDEKQKPPRPKDPPAKCQDSNLSDTSETEKVSLGGKLVAFLSDKTGRLLETIAELAQQVVSDN